MKTGKITLKSEMIAVLREFGHPMSADKLADIIKQRGRWVRPSDGMPAEGWQIVLRARRHPDLFNPPSVNMISLKEWE